MTFRVLRAGLFKIDLFIEIAFLWCRIYSYLRYMVIYRTVKISVNLRCWLLEACKAKLSFRSVSVQSANSSVAVHHYHHLFNWRVVTASKQFFISLPVPGNATGSHVCSFLSYFVTWNELNKLECDQYSQNIFF